MLFKVHSTWLAVALKVALPSGIALIPTFASAETPPISNTNPNPLLFPTRTEEVKIQENVPITLNQALELAQRNNNDIQVVKLDLERSRSSLRESQAALFPNVSVNGSITNSGNGFINNSSSSSSTSFNGQGQINYDLYTSGNRQGSIQAAEEQLRVDELSVEGKLLDIRLNVKTQYYNLQQADEQVRINRSSVENFQASLRDAQSRLQAGVGTTFDVLQAQVNLANSVQNLTNAISQQQIARRQLVTLLNLPQSINITAADPVQLSGLWQKTLEESIIQAFQNRLELKQFLAQRNIAEQQRIQALSQLGPQISLSGSYNLLDSFNDVSTVSDGYSLGLQASLNLFDGGAARARAAQSKTDIAIAETQFSSQLSQIRFDIEQYYLQLQPNLDNVQTSTLAITQAKEALSIARLRLQAGVGTQTDVISAENDLTTAEGNRVTAILNYNRALANLQRSSNQQ